jgi:hypothetical protein
MKSLVVNSLSGRKCGFVSQPTLWHRTSNLHDDISCSAKANLSYVTGATVASA